jgi:hypothetical protein
MFEIYDWKRCKEFVYYNLYREKGVTPACSELDNCNFWHYSLQLNIYRRILQEKYGLSIDKIFLICLHPNYDSYQRVQVSPMDEVVEVIFRERRNLFLGDKGSLEEIDLSSGEKEA